MEEIYMDPPPSIPFLQLVFTLLLPCLIFSQLGQAAILEKMLAWWFIPMNVVLSSIAGSLMCARGRRRCLGFKDKAPPELNYKFTQNILLIHLCTKGSYLYTTFICLSTNFATTLYSCNYFVTTN